MSSLQSSADDPAMLELFRAELDTHLPVLSDGLLALEKDRADDQTVAGMMRAAHSIKGAARIVGMEAAVRVAHAMEDCFTAAKDQRIILTSAVVEVLLKGVDAIQRICSPQPDAAPEPAGLDGLLERIAAVRDGRVPAPPPAAGRAAAGLTSGPPSQSEPRPADERLITLPAELDDAAAEQLRASLCNAIHDGASRICLDFTKVDRVSAQALSVLIALVREAAGTASVVAALGVGGDLVRLMCVSGLDRAWSTDG